MSEWSDDCKNKAIEILPKSLNFLGNELSFFLNTITPELKYTELTSRLHHRIGECSILAEIAEKKYISTLIDTLHSQLKGIYSGINYEGSVADITHIQNRVMETSQALINESKDSYLIDVGNYREEAR